MMAGPFPPVVLNTTLPATQLFSQFNQFVTFQTPFAWVMAVFVFDALLAVVEAPRSENLIILFRNLAFWDFIIGLLMLALKNIGWIAVPVTFIIGYLSVIGLVLAITLIVSSFQ
jgi:hypothetical protein